MNSNIRKIRKALISTAKKAGDDWHKCGNGEVYICLTLGMLPLSFDRLCAELYGSSDVRRILRGVAMREEHGITVEFVAGLDNIQVRRLKG